MKILGYALIVAGFLVGALVSVVEELEVSWGYYLIALAAGALGVAIVRVSSTREAKAEDKLATDIKNIHESLARIVEKVTALNQQKAEINPYDYRHRIDDELPEDLNAFVEARESIGHVYGLQSYADVMSIFASGGVALVTADRLR